MARQWNPSEQRRALGAACALSSGRGADVSGIAEKQIPRELKLARNDKKLESIRHGFTGCGKMHAFL